MLILFLRTSFMNRRECKATRQARGCCASVDPSELKSDQRQCQVFGTGEQASFFWFHEDGGNASLIERVEEGRFALGPLVGIPAPIRNQPSHRASSDGSGGLHQELQIEAV
jgi:hypothetical protein